MVIAGVSLLVTLLGLGAVPIAGIRLQTSLRDTIGIAQATIEGASSGLALAENSLEEVGEVTTALHGISESVGNGIGSMDELIVSLTTFTGEELPGVLNATTQSMVTAEQSAQALEGYLFRLNSISFLTGISYEPQTTLEESFGKISTNLQALPATLEDTTSSLENLQGDLDAVDASMQTLTESIAQIDSNVGQAQEIVRVYTLILDDVQVRINRAEESAPRWLSIATWGLEFVLLWMAFSQIGWLYQGWERLQAARGI
jgi:archaellum component FlaC